MIITYRNPFVVVFVVPGLQSEAAVALANCDKIARRKFLIQRQQELANQESQLELLLGKKIPRDAGGKFKQESLCDLNTSTLQVIVNDLHSKIERLNEQLMHLVIEKDELQVSGAQRTIVTIECILLPHIREHRWARVSFALHPWEGLTKKGGGESKREW